MAYISVRNWKKFQHYSDRNPPWIKMYVELMSNEDYLNLTGHQRGVLSGLWLTYASSHAHLKLDTRTLTYRLRLRVTTADIETLAEAGFIDIVASKALAEGYQDAGEDADARATRDINKGSQKYLNPSSSRVRSKTTADTSEATRPDPLLNDESHKVEEEDWAADSSVNGTPDEFGPQPLPVAGELEALRQRYSEE